MSKVVVLSNVVQIIEREGEHMFKLDIPEGVKPDMVAELIWVILSDAHGKSPECHPYTVLRHVGDYLKHGKEQ